MLRHHVCTFKPHESHSSQVSSAVVNLVVYFTLAVNGCACKFLTIDCVQRIIRCLVLHAPNSMYHLGLWCYMYSVYIYILCEVCHVITYGVCMGACWSVNKMKFHLKSCELIGFSSVWPVVKYSYLLQHPFILSLERVAVRQSLLIMLVFSCCTCDDCSISIILLQITNTAFASKS